MAAELLSSNLAAELLLFTLAAYSPMVPTWFLSHVRLQLRILSRDQ